MDERPDQCLVLRRNLFHETLDFGESGRFDLPFLLRIGGLNDRSNRRIDSSSGSLQVVGGH